MPEDFLGEDEFIECSDPQVSALAGELRSAAADDVAYARAAFEWVRDRVGHSWDVGPAEPPRRHPVTHDE